MQRLWQPLCHVASLMNLATLDRCVGTEGPTNDLTQRLGTVDDEQPADLWVEPAHGGARPRPRGRSGHRRQRREPGGFASKAKEQPHALKHGAATQEREGVLPANITSRRTPT